MLPNAQTRPALPRAADFATLDRLHSFVKAQGSMGHRLSRIVTRTGDAGTTGLGDGSRVAKDAPRIAALGDVDELNSLIGLLLCEDLPAEAREPSSAWPAGWADSSCPSCSAP